VRQIGRNQHLADVTEIFNHLDKEKSVRMGKAMLYALVFLTAAYRGTERGVNMFLDPEEKAKMAEFFKDAVASSVHHF
jgi:hypothetical protein